jgi:hypothetical protein
MSQKGLSRPVQALNYLICEDKTKEKERNEDGEEKKERVDGGEWETKQELFRVFLTEIF